MPCCLFCLPSQHYCLLLSLLMCPFCTAHIHSFHEAIDVQRRKWAKVKVRVTRLRRRWYDADALPLLLVYEPDEALLLLALLRHLTLFAFHLFPLIIETSAEDAPTGQHSIAIQQDCSTCSADQFAWPLYTHMVHCFLVPVHWTQLTLIYIRFILLSAN